MIWSAKKARKVMENKDVMTNTESWWKRKSYDRVRQKALVNMYMDLWYIIQREVRDAAKNNKPSVNIYYDEFMLGYYRESVSDFVSDNSKLVKLEDKDVELIMDVIQREMKIKLLDKGYQVAIEEPKLIDGTEEYKIHISWDKL